MIKIPRCFFCDHFIDSDKQTGMCRCRAFPKGIPKEVFLRNAYAKEECAAGFHYKGELSKYM